MAVQVGKLGSIQGKQAVTAGSRWVASWAQDRCSGLLCLQSASALPLHGVIPLGQSAKYCGRAQVMET